jgi:hypothetical protein
LRSIRLNLLAQLSATSTNEQPFEGHLEKESCIAKDRSESISE